MEVVSYCPKCFKGARFQTGEAPEAVVCGRCTDRRDVTLTESVRDRNVVDRCLLCGCGHFYIEKDFNRTAGFVVVVVAAVASAIAWAYNVYVSVGILAAAALLDLAVWLVSKERAVCYKCEAYYRGAAPNPAHGRYELGVAGRFSDDYDEQNRRRSD